jgi:hypothetical protein
MFKTVTDANHAHQVNLLMIPEPTAIPQDQHAHAPKLLTQTTNAKIAQLNKLLIMVTLNASQLQLAQDQVNILDLSKTAIDVDNANKDG